MEGCTGISFWTQVSSWGKTATKQRPTPAPATWDPFSLEVVVMMLLLLLALSAYRLPTQEPAVAPYCGVKSQPHCLSLKTFFKSSIHSLKFSLTTSGTHHLFPESVSSPCSTLPAHLCSCCIRCLEFPPYSTCNDSYSTSLFGGGLGTGEPSFWTCK